ncbi:MAG: ABC transporter ATP-binding protein, partial [Gemmatimonadaceae bacterium]
MTVAVRTATPWLAGAYAPPVGASSVDAAVELDGLRKRFAVRRSWHATLRNPSATAHVQAVSGISLRVPAGSCFGILGPNGAGKSTLFRILSTLVLPDAGRATVCGLDVVQDSAAVRDVLSGAGTDERSLFWRLSAAENLRLYASLQGMRGAARATRVEEALGIVGLEEMGGQLVGRFSSGLRQRLLLARALLGRPRVLLLDEPTRSLDPVAARTFREFLRSEIVDRQGCTVLLATHGADEAFDLCDRVAVLHAGRVVAEGRAAELAAALVADRMVLWTRTPRHPVLLDPARLRPGAARLPDVPAAPSDGAAGTGEGWVPVTLRVPGGAAAGAELLRWLVAASVPVARLAP